MIDLETRLLEILDWDEDRLQRAYDKAAKFLSKCKLVDRGSIEEALVHHMRSNVTEEGARILFKVLDQNIRIEMRIIEE